MQTAGHRLMARPRRGEDFFLRGMPEGLATVPVPVRGSSFTTCSRLWPRPPPHDNRGAGDRAIRVRPMDDALQRFAGFLGHVPDWRPWRAFCRRGSAATGCGVQRLLRPSPPRLSSPATAVSSCVDTAPLARSGCAAGRHCAGPEAARRVSGHAQHLRLAEALLFAAGEPLSEEALGNALAMPRTLPECCATSPRAMTGAASTWYGWLAAGRFAPRPISPAFADRAPGRRKLSRAAVETLAVIA